VLTDKAPCVVHVLSACWEQVHVLTDNAGMELVSDLALAHYLLAAGLSCREPHRMLHQMLLVSIMTCSI
jgi:hypothetical protein